MSVGDLARLADALMDRGGHVAVDLEFGKDGRTVVITGSIKADRKSVV